MIRTILVLALCASSAGAVDAGPPTEAPAAEAAEPSPAEKEPSPSEIVQGVEEVAKSIGDWKTVGPLGVAVALLALLGQFTKLRLFRKLLDGRGLGWLRPVIIAAVGGLAALVTALQSGAGIGSAFIAGVLAGLGGIGAHEVARLGSREERSRVRVTAEAVSKATDALRRAAEERSLADGKATALKAELDELTKLPENRRLEKLAELLRRKG